MNDVIFLIIAVVFVLVALLSTVATTGTSLTVRRIANRAIYCCCIAALFSVVLAAWFLYRAVA